MKRAFTIFFTFIFMLASAHAETSAVNIRELRESMPKCWDCEITTDDGETVFINAPISIPDVDTIPVLLCNTQIDVDHINDFTFQCGKDRFIFGKTDSYERPTIYNPSAFPEPESRLEDLLVFVKQRLASAGVENVEPVLYSYNALGPLCKTKSQKWTSDDGKVSFRVIVPDPEKPWKNDNSHGWECDLTQLIEGIPVFPTYYKYGHASLAYDNIPAGFLRYINEENYYLWMATLQPSGVLSPDTDLLPPEELFRILKDRVRDGRLQSVIEIKLGYHSVEPATAQVLGFHPEQDYEYLLCPVWIVRGYDTLLEEEKKNSMVMMPFEDEVRCDPNHVYYLLIDARTGEIINYLSEE